MDDPDLSLWWRTRAVTLWWRNYALALGRAATQDASEPINLDLVFRVADLACGEEPPGRPNHF